MQKLLPAIRSAAAYVPSEAVDGGSHPFHPAHPLNRPLRAPGALRSMKRLLCQIYGKPQMNNRIKVSNCPPLQIVIPLEILRLF